MVPLVFEFRYDRWCGWLLGIMGLGRRHARVVVDTDRVDIVMGWGFRARVPRERIAGAGVAERPFLGWGVHGWRGRWLVNGSSSGIVRIDIDPPARGWTLGVPLRLRTVYVSLVDPDRLGSALASTGPAATPLDDD